ncbi:hypothetical protein Bbelb_436380 [Branchiostoma belcheri]|nr:hypothetical protein Bbelb_436380 [Branchiostoma belcheri]
MPSTASTTYEGGPSRQAHPDGNEIPYDFLWPGTGRIDTSNRDSGGSSEEHPQHVDRKELDNALHGTADEEPSDFEYLEDWEDWSEMDNRHRNGEGNNNKAVGTHGSPTEKDTAMTEV